MYRLASDIISLQQMARVDRQIGELGPGTALSPEPLVACDSQHNLCWTIFRTVRGWHRFLFEASGKEPGNKRFERRQSVPSEWG